MSRFPSPPRLILALALCVVASSASAADWLYLTRPGDTLIGIGQTYLKDPRQWPRIQGVNGVANPRRLPTDTRLKIPVELLKVTPAPAVVTHVQGNVRVRPLDGGYRPLSVGEQIVGGETVLTGPRSFAAFRLADGSRLNQQPTSKLSFGRLAAYAGTGMVATELQLDGGRLEASAGRQIGPAGGFRVVTPVAVAGLRGTDFRLNLADDGQALRSEVLEGGVALAAAGAEVLVGGGQGTVAEAGQPPEAPRPLLPAPDGSGLPARVIDLPLAFSWRGQDGAHAWRAQVATDAAFERVLLDETSAQTALRSDEALPDGNYVLRLRAIDGRGLEGFNLDHPFELAARPLPPRPAAPADAATLDGSTVALSWTAAEGAAGYLLEIAGEGAPVSRRLGAVTGHTEALAPGEYRWRLASLGGDGQARGWGAGRAFRVQRQPAPAPRELVVRQVGDGLDIRWTGSAAAYRLEIAADPQFAAVLERHRSTATESRLSRPRAGRYWVRVIGLGEDGEAGGISPTVAVRIRAWTW